MRTKVLTYNLRCESGSDGLNRFTNRADFVFAKIAELAPDIIGFQEALPAMRDALAARLDGYALAGTARDRDYGGECCPVAYRADLYELHSLRTFWLSPTPDVPGSRFAPDQSRCPRVCTAVRLRRKPDGEVFCFYNTHLDHVGAAARVMGAALILADVNAARRRSDGVTERVVLTGDFNATPDSPEIAALSAALTNVTSNVGNTFHGFTGVAADQIDYIFTDAPCASARAVTDTRATPDGVLYLSDHFPVEAVIDL